jgi:c-di-GMP-related signal transduction protein
MTNIFLARQPILNHDQSVEGYELLYRGGSLRELACRALKLTPYGLTLVAEKIETYDDFQLAAAAGADLFQGYFFCRPHLIGGRRIPPSRLALMRLASTLQDPTIELAELEPLISGDGALSYRLPGRLRTGRRRSDSRSACSRCSMP